MQEGCRKSAAGLQNYFGCHFICKSLGLSGGMVSKIAFGKITRMTALNSSCLAGVEYAAGTMILRFRNGRTYTLRGVPARHYRGLLQASSPGWYFNTYLKGRY